jgi:hypothetical protein
MKFDNAGTIPSWLFHQILEGYNSLDGTLDASPSNVGHEDNSDSSGVQECYYASPP